MANEIANRSHAGLSCELFITPDPPIILGSWGLDTTNGITREAAIGDGIYSIPLVDPIGAFTNLTGGGYVRVQGFAIGEAISGGNKFVFALTNTPGVQLPSNSQVNLTHLLMTISTTLGVSVDADVPQASCIIHRLPQQD